MASAAAEPVVAELSTQTYNALVDPMLEELSIELEELLETHDIDALEEERGGDPSDWDVEYATGVLTLRLGSYGTYVINKQPPSRQIWLSSPSSSGPKRFDYDATNKVWFTNKEGELHYFHELLTRELSEVLGEPVDLSIAS
ncbi:mitochondrial matrix protein frataxin [Malassezia pachydermatis]|uniref:Mitochondrial matrix protein frataxin n=1 Tax=Malassezia pachydermatis TaxID=77020 RepID=A0A0N0RS57_9BASI|nr:mitochondrial matrix protein frataxin [Malassezia pachydermatis]KOS13929.1 mitochondrial matrix protein frataxin [Malassezia pachydermatis]